MEFLRVWNTFGSFLSFSFLLVCSLLARFSQISQHRVASLAKCSWIKWNRVITEVNSAGKKRVLDDLLLLLIYIKQGWYCINISKYQYLMVIMTIKSEFSNYCVNLFGTAMLTQYSTFLYPSSFYSLFSSSESNHIKY